MREVKLGKNIKEIGEYAFKECPIQECILPDTVSTIGEGAFYNCKKLTGINIPDSVTIIRFCTFCGCQELKSVKIGKSVNSIMASAFLDCWKLEDVNFPDSVTYIGTGAFGHTSLKNIKLPPFISFLGEEAFYINRLEHPIVVEIPDSLVYFLINTFPISNNIELKRKDGTIYEGEQDMHRPEENRFSVVRPHMHDMFLI